MQVEFRKTASRRYAIVVRRGDNILEMDPAAGFDPEVPHDLVHFIVERSLGIDGAVFGQLARGGNAGGSFRLQGERRAIRKQKRKGDALAKKERDAMQVSERATVQCVAELRGEPYSLADGWSRDDIRGAAAELGRASARWQQIAVGESVSFEW